MRIFTKTVLVTFTLAASLVSPASWSDEKKPAPNEVHRSKSIAFDDELVEGMNQNPFDSMENLAALDESKDNRLYKKKRHFFLEMKEQAREMGVSP